MSKEELIVAIKAAAGKLGRAPYVPELARMYPGMNRHTIEKYFGSFRMALEACDLKPRTYNTRVRLVDLFEDFAEVVRQNGKMPTRVEHTLYSKFSYSSLMRRLGTWSNVCRSFERYAKSHNQDGKYADVLELMETLVKDEEQDEGEIAKVIMPKLTVAEKLPEDLWSPTLIEERPVYGSPIMLPAMAFAPSNEAGVMFLFALVAERLGFMVTRLQAGFPDCEALLRIDDYRVQLRKIEFEFESRSFLKHGHNPEECDMIVCWMHDWPACPLEVLELRKIVAEICRGRACMPPSSRLGQDPD